MNAPDYDFRDKMRENRRQWSDIGVTTSSIVAPAKYKDYFIALATIVTAKHLMQYVQERDHEVMTAFANRQPRVPVTIDDLFVLRDTLTDTKLTEQVEDLIRLMREKRLANHDGKAAAERGDEEEVLYNFSREYAIAYYIRGAYALFKLRMSGNVPDLDFGTM